jgi:hypothetical protein
MQRDSESVIRSGWDAALAHVAGRDLNREAIVHIGIPSPKSRIPTRAYGRYGQREAKRKSQKAAELQNMDAHEFYVIADCDVAMEVRII